MTATKQYRVAKNFSDQKGKQWAVGEPYKSENNAHIQENLRNGNIQEVDASQAQAAGDMAQGQAGGAPPDVGQGQQRKANDPGQQQR